MSDMHECTLQDWCDTLHCSTTGTSDPLSDERTAQIVEYIKHRLGGWNHSSGPWKFYDNAVRHLCLMTLLEHDRAQAICPSCHGPRATESDLKRSHDKALPDETQVWEAALCWVLFDGGHADPLVPGAPA